MSISPGPQRPCGRLRSQSWQNQWIPAEICTKAAQEKVAEQEQEERVRSKSENPVHSFSLWTICTHNDSLTPKRNPLPSNYWVGWAASLKMYFTGFHPRSTPAHIKLPSVENLIKSSAFLGFALTYTKFWEKNSTRDLFHIMQSTCVALEQTADRALAANALPPPRLAMRPQCSISLPGAACEAPPHRERNVELRRGAVVDDSP